MSMTTRELRNLEELEAYRTQLRSLEHIRSTIYAAPGTIRALDKDIARIKKRIRKLEK